MSINLLGKCTRARSLLYLFIFSIAAPLGGYIVLGILVLANAKEESIAPGILILVSAGTLIYVGLSHALPEAIQARKGGHSHGHVAPVSGHDNAGLSTSREDIVVENEAQTPTPNEIIQPAPTTSQKIDFIDFFLILLAVVLPIILTLFIEDE